MDAPAPEPGHSPARLRLAALGPRRHRNSASPARLRDLGQHRDRLEDRRCARLSPQGWRADAEHDSARGADRSGLRRPRDRARLAHRAHRPSRRPALGLAFGRAARGAGIRPQLRLGQRGPQPSRPAGRRAGLGPRLLPASLPAGRRRLRRLDPELEEAAAALGYPPFACLPLRRAAAAPARAPRRSAPRRRCTSSPNTASSPRSASTPSPPRSSDQFQSSFNSAAANMLAVPLVLCCAAAPGADAWLRGRIRYARVGSGAPRHAGAAPARTGDAPLPAPSCRGRRARARRARSSPSAAGSPPAAPRSGAPATSPGRSARPSASRSLAAC